MTKMSAILVTLLLSATSVFAEPIFRAISTGPVKGDRTSYENGGFRHATESIAGVSFTIDSSEPEVLEVEVDFSSGDTDTWRFIILNSDDNTIFAINLEDSMGAKSIQLYTLSRRDLTFYRSLQRSNGLSPSVISTLAGKILEIYNDGA